MFFDIVIHHLFYSHEGPSIRVDRRVGKNGRVGVDVYSLFNTVLPWFTSIEGTLVLRLWQQDLPGGLCNYCSVPNTRCKDSIAKGVEVDQSTLSSRLPVICLETA